MTPIGSTFTISRTRLYLGRKLDRDDLSFVLHI